MAKSGGTMRNASLVASNDASPLHGNADAQREGPTRAGGRQGAAKGDRCDTHRHALCDAEERVGTAAAA